MLKTLRILVSLATLAVVVGCQSLAGPDWGHPGSAAEQQRRAERFDPFPQDECGPPIEGARPREFQTPPAEVKRSRWSPADPGF